MNISEDKILSYLKQVGEYEFEELVADIFTEWGWKTVVTSKSQDEGKDIILEKYEPFYQKYAVQVKQHSHKLGRPDIQSYTSILQKENDINGVVIVTTSSFSRPAGDYSQDVRVELISGDDLVELCSDIDIEGILREYLQFKQNKPNSHSEHWLGANIYRYSSIDNADDIVRASEMISEEYGEFKEGPAVLNKGNSCPECSETLYGGEMEYEDESVKCKFCMNCRTVFFKRDDTWVSTDY